jgi:serine/threonine-protein kinase
VRNAWIVQPLANEYELTELIGRGPNGTVWRAQQRATGEVLAVKLLDEQLVRDPAVLDRLTRERPILTAFIHPADVRVREMSSHGGDLALVTELVAGSDLRRHLVHLGPFTPALAARIIGSAAEALAAAHDVGVVHCDIKPSNLLLERPSGDVRITDHRVARLIRGYGEGAERFSDPGYAAPEVILGGPPVPATDVYALGLVLYELLAGVPLCAGSDPIDVLSQHLRRRPVVTLDTVPELRQVVQDCLAVDPAIRPPAQEVAVRLRRLVPTLPGDPEVRAWPPGTVAVPNGRPAAIDRPRPATNGTRPSVELSWQPAERPRPATELRPAAPSQGLRGRPAVLIAFAALILLAGAVAAVVVIRPWHGGKQGGGVAEPSVGTSPRLTSTAGVPEPPSAATAATVDGATAFVKYWFDALNYAVSTGNTASVDAASGPDCETCAAASKAIKDAYQNGGALRGGGYTIRQITTDNFFNVAEPDIDIVFDRSPRSTVTATGQQITVLPGTTFATAQLLLERSDNKWRMRSVLSSASPFA